MKLKFINTTAWVIIASMLFSGVSEAKRFCDVNEDDEYYQAAEELSMLGIVDGYTDGNFKPSKKLTRAEFCKLVVYMMDKANEAKATPPSSSFDDVNKLKWSIPYINYLTSVGMVKGYADATFKPNNSITYAEAITVLCRILGYTEESLGYNWPVNFITQAYSLGLYGSKKYESNDILTRADAVVILEKTLFSNIKVANDIKYIESLGYATVDDVYIIETSKQNSKLARDEVKLFSNNEIQASKSNSFNVSYQASKGEQLSDNSQSSSNGATKSSSRSFSNVTDSFKVKSLEILDYFGQKGSIVLDKNNTIILFSPYGEKSIFDEDNNDYLDLEDAGYTVIENCFISATKKEESSLNSRQIRTSSGVYDVENTDILSKAKKMGTLILNTKKKAIQFIEQDLTKLSVSVSKVNSKDTIEYRTNDGEKGKYTFSDNFVMYYDNNKTTFQAVSSRIEVGTRLTFYSDEDGEWSFAMIDSESEDIIPIRATRDYYDSDTEFEGIPIDKRGLLVHKEDKDVSLSDIKANDIVYYNTATNVMDVYNKKVTGVYNKAIPNKAYVTSVELGGNVYKINEFIDTSRLDTTNGSFEIGDKITLYLGENDEVCYASETRGEQSYNYGVVLKTYKEIVGEGEYEGTSRLMASIMMTDGKTYEYQTDKNYKDDIAKLVKIDIKNGVAKLSQVSKTSKTYGALDVAKRTLGGKKILKNVTIFNLLTDEEDKNNCRAEVIDLEKLGVSELSYGQVIATVEENSFGDICVMYLKNMPSSYRYGLVWNVNENKTKVYSETGEVNTEVTSCEYEIYSEGEMLKFTTAQRLGVKKGPVYFRTGSAGLEVLDSLYDVCDANSIEAIEEGRIKVNGKIYGLADDVQILNISNSECNTYSIETISKLKIKSVKLYSLTKDGLNDVKIVMVEIKK